MKVWITKYALSSGIFEEEGEIYNDKSMLILKRPGRYQEIFHGEGKEWHRSKEAAAARLIVLKEKKIQSLLKQINKIESINF